jgi:Swt1-like HEPN/NPCBM/NEW2 domain
VEPSNRDLIGKGFELLAEGLEPFVEHHMAPFVPGGMDWLTWLAKRPQNRGVKLESKTDPHVLLRTIVQQEQVFKSALSRPQRAYAQELWEGRNEWAHNSVFNEADTRRLLDTMERFLRSLGAVFEADEAQLLLQNYQQVSIPKQKQQPTQPVNGASSATGTPPAPESHRMPPPPGPRGLMTGNIAMLAILAAGMFAVLVVTGLVLLPSATLAEKGLIVVACVSLSAAGLAGLGAWRSLRRFAAVATAGGLAVVCLAGLSVTAARNTRAELTRSTGSHSSASDRPRGNSTPTTGSSPSTGPSPTAQATSNSPQYLAGLPADSGDSDAPQSGSWTIQGHTYAHSIGYGGLGQSVSITYELKGSYRAFLATIGVNDDADPIDQNTPVEFIVYGNPGGGSNSVLSDQTVQWGKPGSVDVDLRGATTLTLVTESASGLISPSSIAVWGNARLFPSA